uniref:Uncharacterized protein n=1 Tax=Physcomitrium patens TaxID=3218 RepID=A0A2K1JGG1_PHYPA|nr:hypothetical protein PHYPA_018002 [Physcomitrium patens]
MATLCAHVCKCSTWPIRHIFIKPTIGSIPLFYTTIWSSFVQATGYASQPNFRPTVNCSCAELLTGN